MSIYLVGRQTDILKKLFSFLTSKFPSFHIETIILDDRRKFPFLKKDIDASNINVCYYIFEGYDTNSRIDEREILVESLLDVFSHINAKKLIVLSPFIKDNYIHLYSNYLLKKGILDVQIFDPISNKEWYTGQEKSNLYIHS